MAVVELEEFLERILLPLLLLDHDEKVLQDLDQKRRPFLQTPRFCVPRSQPLLHALVDLCLPCQLLLEAVARTERLLIPQALLLHGRQSLATTSTHLVISLGCSCTRGTIRIRRRDHCTTFTAPSAAVVTVASVAVAAVASVAAVSMTSMAVVSMASVAVVSIASVAVAISSVAVAIASVAVAIASVAVVATANPRGHLQGHCQHQHQKEAPHFRHGHNLQSLSMMLWCVLLCLGCDVL